MVLVDRGLRRVHRHLQDGEVIVASLAGVEAEGRRRRAIVVTDHRILVTWIRGDTPLELDLEGAVCRYDHSGGLLTLQHDEHEVALRGVDEVAARALVELVANHRSHTATAASAPIPRVRIVADDTLPPQ